MTQVLSFAAPSQLHMPVRAVDRVVLDNSGEVVAICFTAEMAVKVAALLNVDAGANRG